MRGLTEPVLLDEWQQAPGVFRAVDADPRPNRFLLTGSAQAEHEHDVWPGTGRFLRVPMFPMTIRERIGDATAKPFLDRLADGDTRLLVAQAAVERCALVSADARLGTYGVELLW